MYRGPDDRRMGWQAAALVALVSIPILGMTSGCSRSSDDRTIHVTFTFTTPPIPPKPEITADFTNYDTATVPLGLLKWKDATHVDVNFLLPGLGDSKVDAEFTSKNPPLLGRLTQVRPTSEPLEVTLSRPPQDDGGTDGPTSDGAANGGAGGMTGAGGGDAAGGAAGADAGPDAGAGGAAGHPTIGGGGTAGGSMGGAGGCDGGDEDTGPATTIPTCAEYCDALLRYCPSYADNCSDICRGLRWDLIPINPNNIVSNNLRCRIDNAEHFDPDNPPMCVNSTTEPQEPGGCGSPCDVLCDAGKTNCPSQDFFADPIKCRQDCRVLTPTNRKCRVDSLVQAGLRINLEQECLQASQGTGCQ